MLGETGLQRNIKMREERKEERKKEKGWEEKEGKISVTVVVVVHT